VVSTLREEYRLKVYEKRVLRRIFGSMVGGRRKLYNEDLHNLHPSPNIIRMMMSSRMKWAGQVGGIGQNRNVYRILVEKPEGKRPLGRPGVGILLKWILQK
jgi:hypothetical protein